MAICNLVKYDENYNKTGTWFINEPTDDDEYYPKLRMTDEGKVYYID